VAIRPAGGQAPDSVADRFGSALNLARMTHALTQSIDKALSVRLPLFADRQAVRLSHHELADNLTIDDYAGHLLFTAYKRHDPATLQRLAEALLGALDAAGLPAHGAAVKLRPDNLSHAEADPVARPITGQAPPTQFTVREDDATYQVSFEQAGFGTGLFLDMVEGRRFVREHARGARVLNLFSYTGPFSIAAALGGAQRVVEVDTSRKWLAWAQANQRLNGVQAVRQRRHDAVDYLRRADEGSVDLLICDPPSYANPKRGKRFSIARAYPSMARQFARLLKPGGRVLAACNHARTDRPTFANWLGDRLRLERWIEPPPDFPGASYLKVAVMRRVD
jgi:23S rRNA (cytosine1962-C5)-methyltransferase